MPFEIIHFRNAEEILQGKGLSDHVRDTMECIHEDLYERFYRGNMLRQTLDFMGWRDNGGVRLLPDRRYSYKGWRNRVAIEANLQNYEWLLEGLFRLQIGFDKGDIDTGILLLNGYRSKKSPLSENVIQVSREVEALYPTISMPVTVVLFDLGTPKCIDPDNPTSPAVNGGSNQSNDNSKDKEDPVHE